MQTDSVWMNFLKCNICETKTMHGRVSDCNCDFDAVNKAVSQFFLPKLSELTQSRYGRQYLCLYGPDNVILLYYRLFFRYFRVYLERPCPFWQDDSQCMMENCAVCACDDKEIPKVNMSICLCLSVKEYNE